MRAKIVVSQSVSNTWTITLIQRCEKPAILLKTSNVLEVVKALEVYSQAYNYNVTIVQIKE